MEDEFGLKVPWVLEAHFSLLFLQEDRARYKEYAAKKT
jgi:hypothetical protein